MGSSQIQDVRRYFGARAPGYEAGSKSGLWRVFRGWEGTAVLGLARVRAGERVLDAGSGAGHYARLLAAAGARVTALDAEPAMLESLRAALDVETAQADLMTVRLEPVYDKIVCAGVLEFVEDAGRVVRNLAAGLREGGAREMVLLTPGRGVGGRVYRAFHRRHGVRVRLFSRDDLGELAAGAGMRVEAVRRATFNIVTRLGPAR